MRTFLVLLLVAGCASPPETGDSDGSDTDGPVDTDVEGPAATGCYDVPIRLSGGLGADAFTAAADGAIAEIVHGEQPSGPAAWHVDTALSIEAIHPQFEALVTLTDVATGEMISGLGGVSDLNHGFFTLVATGECSGTYVGYRALLDDVVPETEDLATDICPLEGREVDVTWTVTDLVDDRAAETTLRVVLALDETPGEDALASDAALCAAY
ncbi:MAG: hypothetical protein H0V89_02055 [Deltaproteobacteria bacterium]|nr:hypothetical protein [Deltaproteobacteria bacterium]